MLRFARRAAVAVVVVAVSIGCGDDPELRGQQDEPRPSTTAASEATFTPATAAPPVEAVIVTTTTTRPPQPPPVAHAAPSGGVWEHLARIRACESGGNYGAVSSSGKYRGAYQFSRATWDSTASRSGRSDLVGVDPAAASPRDQDAQAHALYTSSGPGQWPHCQYA